MLAVSLARRMRSPLSGRGCLRFLILIFVNVQIREDTKMGVYVDNLSEEFVSSVQDVSRILVKVWVSLSACCNRSWTPNGRLIELLFVYRGWRTGESVPHQ